MHSIKFWSLDNLYIYIYTHSLELQYIMEDKYKLLEEHVSSVMLQREV